MKRQRRVMVGCVSGFTVATFFCGSATSLEALVLWRIAQGALGAPTVPLAQTILLDVFPARQHGIVFGAFGMGVVLGRIIGPAIGGLMAESHGWRCPGSSAHGIWSRLAACPASPRRSRGSRQ